MADSDITLSVTIEASDIKNKANQLRESVSKMFKGADSSQLTKDAQNVLIKMDELVSKSVEVETAIERMENTLVDNPAFTQLNQQISEYERTLSSLDADKQTNLNLGLPTDEIEETISAMEQAYGEALQLRNQMIAVGQQQVTWAEADPDLYNRQLDKLGSLNNQMAVLKTRYEQLGQQVNKTNAQLNKSGGTFNGMHKSIGRLEKSVHRTASNISNAFKNAFSVQGITHFIKRLAMLTLGAYTLTSAFNKLKSAAKQGLDNLVQYQSATNATNRAMTDFKTSLLYLQNAWGAAFAPIINVVMPYLTQLIDAIATVGNYIARFVGALTGKTRVLQAVRVSAGDYAKSLQGVTKNAKSASKAQKQLNDRLAQFDDLNVLGKDKDNDGSGSGAGAQASNGPSPNDMFKYVNVDKSEFGPILELIEKIKKKIKDSGIIEAFKELKKAFDNFKNSPIVKTLEKLIEKLADKAFTSTLSIITNALKLLADILNGDLKKGLQDFKDLLADLTFDPLIGLAMIIDAIFGTDIAGWIEDVKQAIKDIDLSQLKGYEDMVKALEELEDAWNKFKDAVKNFWDMLEETGVLDVLKQVLSDFVALGFDLILQGVASALTLIADALTIIADILNGDFPSLLDDVKDTFADIDFKPLETVASILDRIVGTDISDWLGGVHQGIEDLHFEDFVKSIEDGWEKIKSAFWLGVGIVAAVFGITDEKFNAMKKVVSDVMESIKESLSKAWTDIKTYCSNSITGFLYVMRLGWNELVNIVRTPVNSIIKVINKLLGGLEKMLDGLVDTLNQFKIEIPNWVPQWGGKTLKFNLNKVKLGRVPELAQGAVIPPNREFMAVLGDQSHGTNIEAPLDTIKQAVAEVIANNGNEEVITLLQQLIAVVESKNLTIGDKEIAKANARYTNQQRIIRGASF